MFTRFLAAAAFAASTVAIAAPFAYQPPAFAAKPDIAIPHGQTTVFTMPQGESVERVVVGDTAVAEVLALPGNREILINAKNPGFTNFLVWPSRGPVRNFKLEVLSQRRDETIAVRVQVLEVTERKTGNTGVKWSESLGISEAVPAAPFRFGLPVRTDLLTAQLRLLAQDREIKILAQPTMIIQSGKKASFLSGGELPIPLAQISGGGINYTVEWKQFGIKLDVEPRIEGNNTISMTLRPEVSNIDQENAINIQNLQVPAIATRWAQTYVSLNGGESLVIAGLMRSEKFRVASQLPWLGDIPVLGNLFGATQYDERQSELVFIVTPSVVVNNQVLPEQNYGRGRPGQALPQPQAQPLPRK